MAEAWREFFEQELANLAAKDEFTRDILTAAVFANTDRGHAAESSIRQYLKERYAFMYRTRQSADNNAV